MCIEDIQQFARDLGLFSQCFWISLFRLGAHRIPKEREHGWKGTGAAPLHPLIGNGFGLEVCWAECACTVAPTKITNNCVRFPQNKTVVANCRNQLVRVEPGIVVTAQNTEELVSNANSPFVFSADGIGKGDSIPSVEMAEVEKKLLGVVNWLMSKMNEMLGDEEGKELGLDDYEFV